jgi:hypothetical protein
MTQIDTKPPDATGSYRAAPHCIPCAVLRRHYGVAILAMPRLPNERHRLSSAVVARDRNQRTACADFDVSTIFAARDMGTAKFEPEKPDRMAKFTPITFPLALNTGPPDPPEVVCAS